MTFVHVTELEYANVLEEIGIVICQWTRVVPRWWHAPTDYFVGVFFFVKNKNSTQVISAADFSIHA